MTADAPVSPALPRPNPFQRLIGVLFSPVDTLRQIAERPDWLVALIVMIVFSVAAYFVVAPHLDLETTLREQFEARGGIDQEMIDRQVEMALKISKYTAPIQIVFIPIMYVVIAAVFLLAFKLMGGEGTFKQFFSVTIYSWVPQILKAIASSIIIATRGKMTAPEMESLVKSNLGFLADQKSAPIPFAFLSSIDIFNIWMVVLLVIGLSFGARVSRGKAAGVVVALWIVIILFKIGMAALQSAGGAS